jgi:cytochrome P450
MSLFSAKNVALSILLPNFSFLPFHKRNETNFLIMEDLYRSIIKETKLKLNDKNYKISSMLDLMIKNSNDDKENSLSDEEIRDNVSVFFLAG